MNWGPLLDRLGLGWKPKPEILAQLGEVAVGDGYHRFIFQWDEAFFRKRVEMVGFTGASRVLDAGCGLGQWSVALSRVNDNVVAVDRHANSLETTRRLCAAWDAPNVEILDGAMADLPLEAESFDLVWCSLVIEYTDREETMALFQRVLRPGGRLYITTNARGRWVFKLLKAIAEGNAQRRRVAWRTLRGGRRPGARPNFTNRKDVQALCDRHGFELVQAAADGCLDLRDGTTPERKPMFARRFLGLDNNIEFVAVRR